jgi:hypothetical protein
MMDGWPIAHHVFAGNRLDQTTVGEVIEDLRQRFGLQRVVFVGDRGMVTEKCGTAAPNRAGLLGGFTAPQSQRYSALHRVLAAGLRSRDAAANFLDLGRDGAEA